MNHPWHVDHTVKVNRCIDELLMEDMTFYTQQKLHPNRNSSLITNHQSQITRLFDRKQTIDKQQKQSHNFTTKSSQPSPEITTLKHHEVSIYLSQQKPLNNQVRRRHQHNKSTDTNKTIFQESSFISTSMNQKQHQRSQHQHQWTMNFQPQNNDKQFRIKKTFSYQVNRQVDMRDIDDQVDQVQQSKAYIQEKKYNSYGNDSGDTLELRQENYKTKKKSQKKKYKTLLPPQKKTPKFIKQQRPSEQDNNIRLLNNNISLKNFHLSRQQLQFLSLLYPNESPQQLMLKLLSYYQEEQQYKNSFGQLFHTEDNSRKNQFFRSRNSIGSMMSDSINQLSSGDLDDQFARYEHVKSTQDKKFKNDYSKLKEECLAALGQQMVVTQIKSSTVQTANVNYYTRQYAMPIIMQKVEEKNDEAQGRLEAHQQKVRKEELHLTQRRISALKMTQYQKKVAAVLGQNHEYITPNSSHISSQFVHKVYIPINAKGQTFDIDYQPDSTLFEHISENDYQRILRDINHLIQKIISIHRHSSLLKKKNNPLLRGWNLALLIFLLIIIVMLYMRCYVDTTSDTSQYLEIVVFFFLSLIVILILGNSFNNYKQNVKRSSVIKDICQQVSNYIDFVNCSNKKIKWVLGKDFFWLEIWIYLFKRQTIKK